LKYASANSRHKNPPTLGIANIFYYLCIIKITHYEYDKVLVTGDYASRREDGVLVVPIGTLKD